MMYQKIPVTVSNLQCEILYDLYINIIEENYLIDCAEDKSDDLLRCLKLLENPDCLEDPDCICRDLTLYKRHMPCGGTVVDCTDLTLEVVYPTACTDSINVNITY